MRALADEFEPSDHDYIPVGMVFDCLHDISHIGDLLSEVTSLPRAGVLEQTLLAGSVVLDEDSLLQVLHQLHRLLECVRECLDGLSPGPESRSHEVTCVIRSRTGGPPPGVG